MKYQNLRDWLSIIEHRGELTLVENVDWKLEMGAIVDVLYREHPPYAPALIFDLESRITNQAIERSSAISPRRSASR
jgi:3-polyprenyl-4-hydroxybenzoate decarboxylase